MRNLILLCLVSGLGVMHLSADSIQYSITNLGGNEWQYSYTLSGVYNQYQSIQLDLCSASSGCTDGSLYSNLTGSLGSNSGSDWSLMVYQPNSGADEPGTFQLQSLVNTDPLNGPFSVDFDYTGTGTPGAQYFSVYQLDSNGNYVSTILGAAPGQPVTDGVLTTLLADPVPEPASFAFSGIGLLVLAACKAMRRKAPPAA